MKIALDPIGVVGDQFQGAMDLRKKSRSFEPVGKLGSKGGEEKVDRIFGTAEKNKEQGNEREAKQNIGDGLENDSGFGFFFIDHGVPVGDFVEGEVGEKGDGD